MGGVGAYSATSQTGGGVGVCSLAAFLRLQRLQCGVCGWAFRPRQFPYIEYYRDGDPDLFHPFGILLSERIVGYSYRDGVGHL